jgi:hypothetical protein
MTRQRFTKAQKSALIIGVVVLALIGAGFALRGGPDAGAQSTHTSSAELALAQLRELASQPTDGHATVDGEAFKAKLPDCIPVDTRSGDTAGCVLKSDVYQNPDQMREFIAAHPEGMPVYESAGSGDVVGYLSDGYGFVPKAVSNHSNELVACNRQLTDRLSDPAAPAIDDTCEELLLAQGVRQSDIDAARG